jgi:DnaJ-like protein
VNERRKHQRSKALRSGEDLVISLEELGSRIQISAAARDVAQNSIGVEINRRLPIGARVHVSGVSITESGPRRWQNCVGQVVVCTPLHNGSYLSGIIFEDEASRSSKTRDSQTREQADSPPQNEKVEEVQDYYETLQVNPVAEPETIHRVYRMLAQRYHPDNQETGDAKQFAVVLEAYKVLSDPEQRAAYDINREGTLKKRWKIFETPEMAQGREAERRKRQGILSLLYTTRLMQPHQPTMSIPEIERLLGCPREHLEFPFWYLKESGCIQRSDNGRYVITLKGVDAAEQGPLVPESRMLTAAD